MNNSKVLISLGCFFAATLSAPLVTAAGHGGGGGHGGGFSGGHSFAGRPGMGMPGRPGMGMPGRPGMGMRGPFMPRSMGRMPMQRFGNRDFNRNDRFGRFNRFNNRDFDRDDRFNRFNRFNNFNNDFIFIGDFGFPWWWGGWGPWWGGGWGWGGGYPYGYYGGYGSGYGYGGYYGGYNYGGYGSGYGYGGSGGSRVAELQRRLARAGYYHGAIDGIMGPATRRAIRAYERDSGYEG
jgi:putative peptidoglycan binding protein